MSIQFTKMHGLGNDFMVVDAIRQKIKFTPSQIKILSDRHTGIGFDQCLLIEKSDNPAIDFFYRIFNADGQEVGQCGNGARCLARFLKHYGLTSKKEIQVATKTTQMKLRINDDETVTVNMGKPCLKPEDIPLLAVEQDVHYPLPIEDVTYSVHAVSVGNPHAVMIVDDLQQAPVHTLGKQISEHTSFPEQTNVGFMQIIDASHIRLRVYERGCGETAACGSGAVAAVAIGRLFHQLKEKVQVSLPGGDLVIDWPSFDSSIYLTGPAAFVYEGTLLCE
jgi:diaminopimelate epimerase